MNRMLVLALVILSIAAVSSVADVGCGFVVDLAPPYIVAGSAFPPADTTIQDTMITIAFALNDDGAGVWTDSVVASVIVNGTDTTDYFTPMISGNFSSGDTVEICVHAIDMIFDTLYCTCPPNVLDSCWTFYIEQSCSTWIDTAWFSEETNCDGYDVVEFCYRLNSTCEPPWDIGIAASSNGGASWSVPIGSIFDEAGDVGTVSDTGVHCFNWLLSDDLPDFEGCDFAFVADGDSFASTYIANGCLDSDPPRLSISCPGDSIFAGSAVHISWHIEDLFYSGDPCSLSIFSGPCGISFVSAADTTFDWTVPLSACESCTLVVAARDSFCNWGRDTCVFEIVSGSIAAILIEPIDSNLDSRTISSCADQVVRWLLDHDFDIVAESTSVEICGVEYRWPDPHLTLIGDTLTWNPLGDRLWSDGDSCSICLTSLWDISGAHIGLPVCGDLIIDLSPPEATAFAPASGSTVSLTSADIAVDALDAICGDVIYDSLTVTAPLSGIDTTFIGTSTGNISGLASLDTVTVCAFFSDGCADYCGPNVGDSCWSFNIFYCTAGPFANVVYPDSCGYITSCADQGIAWEILDTTGFAIDDTTFRVRLVVDGPTGPIDTVLTMSGGALVWDGVSRLDFDPSAIGMVFTSWDTVTGTLLGANNAAGCPLDASVSCSFIVDTDPPVVLGGFSPPPDTVFEGYPVSFIISADVYDSICAFTTTRMLLEIWRADSLISDTAWPMGELLVLGSAENNDSLRICVINITDYPDYDYCPPNSAPDTCWWVYIFFSDGPNARIIEPVDLDGDGIAASACDCQPIIIGIFDEDGIDTSTIQLEVEGTVYDLSSPELSWDDDSLLTFMPSAPCWSDGQTVEYTLLAADDVFGAALSSSVSGSFIADYEPPYLSGSYPADGASISGAIDGEIYLVFDDSLSEIAHDSLTYTISFGGTDYVFGPEWNWSGDSFFIAGSDTLDFDGSVTVCIDGSIYDSPDYCENGLADACIDFYVVTGNIFAECIAPTDLNGDGRIVSACECPELRWLVNSTYPLVDSSARVEVDGVVYSPPDAALLFSASMDTLIWNSAGSICFSDGDVVPFSLDMLLDVFGDSLPFPVSDSLIVDTLPPFIEFTSPYPSAGSRNPLFAIVPRDLIGGVDFDTFALTIDGIDGGPSSPYSYLVGDTIFFDMALYPDSFDIGDSILVEITIWDFVDYCDPNRLDTSWIVTLDDTVPPTADLISPFSGAVSACDLQGVVWALYDHETEIDTERIWISVDGTVYSIFDSELEYAPSGSLAFTPSSAWTEGPHSVCLDSAYDISDNPLYGPICSDFYVDYSPPEIVFIEPPCSSEVHDDSASIVITLTDDPAGVYWGASWIGFADDIFYFASDTMTITVSMLDTLWHDGDTVSYCVHAADSADFCTGDNDTIVCCEFYVAIGELYADAIIPDDGAATSCSLQVAAWLFDGAVTRSDIHVTLNDSADFTTHSSELAFSGDTLFFVPTTAWSNGDSIELCLVDASDSFGVHIDDTVCVSFIVDFEPPLFADPMPTGDIATTSPIVSLRLWDEIAGLDLDSVAMFVDGMEVDPVLIGDTLTFDPADSGMSWLGGDTIEVCVWAADLAMYCGANSDSICWEFDISAGGPIITVIEPPDDSLWSACIGQGAIFGMSDPDGIDTSTIELTIDGSVSTEWVFRNDSLIFDPSSGPFDGDTVTVCATASDILGNPAYRCVTYFVDYSAPTIVSMSPAPNSEIAAAITFSINLADSGSGIDDSSIGLTVNGLDYFAGDGYLSWDGSELRLVPAASFAAGETVLVCLDSILDSPDLCDPNVLDSCWSYVVEILPDLWTSDSLISISPISIAEGDSFAFDGIGIYEGNDTLANFFVEIMAGGSILRRVEYYDFAPGDTIFESGRFASAGFGAGEYSICLRLDSDDDIIESNEANNIGCVDITLSSVDCDVRPNPFSPNSDAINDEARFSYPGQSSRDGTVELFDLDGNLVVELREPCVWDGNDAAGNAMPKGVYVYIVLRDGKVICKGTVYIAR